MENEKMTYDELEKTYNQLQIKYQACVAAYGECINNLMADAYEEFDEFTTFDNNTTHNERLETLMKYHKDNPSKRFPSKL